MKHSGLFGLVLCGVLSMTAPGEAKTHVLKFATVAPDGTPWAKQLEDIKKRIEKESKGEIKVKLFLGGVLGGEVETVRALRRGRIQGWGGSTAAVAEGAQIPQLELLELPFLFDTFSEVDHVLDKVVHADYDKLLGAKGFFFAMWHENGWRNFASKSRPILKVSDIKGMKMRSQESKVHLAMYRALGAQAESIPVPEVLGALKTGMVDGFDNTLLFSSATGWYEGIKHYTISEHIYQPAVILYGKRFMDGLSAEQRKIVLGDQVKETIRGRKMVRDMRGALIKNFKDARIKIYELKPADRQEFVKRCAKVHKELETKLGKKLLAKVTGALKKLRKK